MHKQRWVLVLAAASSFMVSLDALVVTTALPTIRHELGASLSSLEWTVNAYTLSFAVLLMSAAALGDRYGRRRLFSFGVALFGAASIPLSYVGARVALRTHSVKLERVYGAVIATLGVTLLVATTR